MPPLSATAEAAPYSVTPAFVMHGLSTATCGIRLADILSPSEVGSDF